MLHFVFSVLISIGEEAADNESATKAKISRTRSRTGFYFYCLLHIETDLHGAPQKMGDEHLIKGNMPNAKLVEILPGRR